MMKNNIIAIDGPSGSGKSTISKILSKDLNLTYIDTGAMYRALTYKILKSNIDLEDDKIAKILENTDIDFNDNNLYLDGELLQNQLRTSDIDKNVSLVSSKKVVRDFLSKIQIEIGNKKPSVMDGRDIGTVLFPNALLKIFLSADVRERAKRRYNQNKRRGIESASVEDLVLDMIRRDEVDKKREIAPLAKAEDAIEIDTTHSSIDDIVGLIKKLYEERLNV